MSNTSLQYSSSHRLLVHVLALMFGIGTWIGVNGIYMQLPLLVNTAPEGWRLPVYLVMMMQLANLGPILYTLSIKCTKQMRDQYIIYGLLGIACIAKIGLPCIYDKTSEIFGNLHSTSLLGLMFVTAAVGCTSPVLFMPYMRNYREIYLATYLMGNGLSSFVPGILALVQGVGGNLECVNTTTPESSTHTYEMYHPKPRFSKEIFFASMGVLSFLGFLSFFGLNNLKVARGERVKQPDRETLPTDANAPPNYKITSDWTMSRPMYVYLLCMMSVICFLGHSTLPSIQTYSCLPYGIMAYHLTVTLTSLITPLSMCLGYMLKDPVSPAFFTWLTGAILVLSSFVFYLAVESPNPLFQHSWIGEFMVVIPWVLVSGLIGFVKMGIMMLFKPDPGQRLYYISAAAQIGCLVGAITIFVLINYTGTFKSYSPCHKFTRH